MTKKGRSLKVGQLGRIVALTNTLSALRSLRQASDGATRSLRGLSRAAMLFPGFGLKAVDKALRGLDMPAYLGQLRASEFSRLPDFPSQHELHGVVWIWN